MGAAITVVAILCLLNLTLTLFVARRVRRHGEEFSARPPAQPPAGLPIGSVIPEFTARTTAGETVTRDSLIGGRSVIAFLSAGCPPCERQMPMLREYASTKADGDGPVLAIISGEDELTGQEITELGEAVSVVTEPRRGPLAATFSVSGFPMFYLVSSDGQVVTRSLSVGGLGQLARRRRPRLAVAGQRAR